MTVNASLRRLGAACLLAVLAGWTTRPAEGARTHIVSIKGFAFAPSKVVAAVGDTIAWANEDIVVHTVTADTARWDSGDLANGRRYRLVASRKGTFDYHCELHPNMKGTLVVQ